MCRRCCNGVGTHRNGTDHQVQPILLSASDRREIHNTYSDTWMLQHWCDMHDVHQLKFLLKCLLKHWVDQHHNSTHHNYNACITANKQPHPPKSHSESTTQRVVWVSVGYVTSVVDTKRDSYFSVLYVLCVISYGRVVCRSSKRVLTYFRL